jgi:hypothetical protein
MKTDCFPNDIVSVISEPRFHYLMTNQLWSRPTWLIVTQMLKSRFVPIDRFTRSRPKHPADQFRSPADVTIERFQFTGLVQASILWSSDESTVDDVDTNVIRRSEFSTLQTALSRPRSTNVTRQRTAFHQNVAKVSQRVTERSPSRYSIDTTNRQISSSLRSISPIRRQCERHVLSQSRTPLHRN